MSNKTRKLMFKVMDNDPNPQLINLMYEIGKYTYRDKILEWLYLNKIVGKKLLETWEHQFRFSVMSLVKFVIMRYNKSRTEAPVIYGKDWK